MEEQKEIIIGELEYYQSGIKQLYMKYYQTCLMLLLLVISITFFMMMTFSSLGKFIFCLFLLLEGLFAVYLIQFTKKSSFEKVFTQMKEQLPQEIEPIQLLKVQEDDKNYYFSNDRLFVKLNKKNTRNFPSKLPQHTLLVGFPTRIDKETVEQPLYFFYYDITQITYSENYKKELIENTNFSEKQKKRNIRSFMFIGLVVLLIILSIYFG